MLPAGSRRVWPFVAVIPPGAHPTWRGGRILDLAWLVRATLEDVRGALVGRNVLYPGRDDPLAMALAVNGVVHRGYSVEQALECMAKQRGQNLGIFKKLAK